MDCNNLLQTGTACFIHTGCFIICKTIKSIFNGSAPIGHPVGAGLAWACNLSLYLFYTKFNSFFICSIFVKATWQSELKSSSLLKFIFTPK